MKRLIFLSLLISAIVACKPGVPKDIIQPVEMEKVLYDIHLVDGYINSIPVIDSAKTVSAAYYKGIYKKFGIDSALYNQSLDYYYSRPDLLKTMYEHISDQLNKAKEAQSKANIKEQKRQAKADSIKNVNGIKSIKVDSITQQKLNDAKIQKRKDSLKIDSIRKSSIKNIFDKKKISAKRTTQ